MQQHRNDAVDHSFAFRRNGFRRPGTAGCLSSIGTRCYTGTNEAIMNLQPNVCMDKAAFLDRMQATEERCELAGGRVVMMPGASRAHARIVRKLIAALSIRLDPLRWEVFEEFGVDVGPDTLRYPDVVVDRAGGGNKDCTATAPVLLAEVLSPSTAEIDLGDKAAEYLRIPSVLTYMVLSQDEPKAWVYLRTDSHLRAPNWSSAPTQSFALRI
jgi:Uma2 family endonuclease